MGHAQISYSYTIGGSAQYHGVAENGEKYKIHLQTYPKSEEVQLTYVRKNEEQRVRMDARKFMDLVEALVNSIEKIE